MRSHSAPVTSWKRVGEVMPALLTSAPTGGAEALERAQGGLDGVLVGDVAGEAEGLDAAAFGDVVGGLFGAGLVEVEDGDVPAVGGQGVGGAAADAAGGGGSGDDGGEVGVGHGWFLCSGAVGIGGLVDRVLRRAEPVREALTLVTMASVESP